MTNSIDETGSQDIRALLNSYFPDAKLNDEALTTKQIDEGKILFKPEQILPYLQTIFFEEHLLELQLDQSTRVFFTNILDDNPDIKGDENDEDGIISDYEIGSYLKAADNFLLTPLTPGIGNARIRSCKLVVVRFFMGTTAVELGCTFRNQEMLEGTPALRFDFPVIARINRNYRPFRVKVVWGVDAHIRILSPKSANTPEKIYRIDDVSGMGLAFEVPTEKWNFEIGETIRFTVHVSGISDLEIGGTIRRTRKVRDIKGYKNICGVQFDLETRSLAEKIERLAAAIQRLQLREIAEKTAYMRGVRLIK